MILSEEVWMGIRGLITQNVNSVTGTLRDIAEGQEDPEAAFRDMMEEYAKIVKKKFHEFETTQFLDPFKKHDNPRTPTKPR